MAKQITDYANEVLNEKRLKDMRDSIAGGLLTSASLAIDSKESSEQVLAKQNTLEQRFINLQQATTNGDFNSAPEIIEARGGKPTLGQRLDETTAQLAEKANKLKNVFQGETYGTFNNANVLGAVGNEEDGYEARIMGVRSGKNAAEYPSRDSAALYVSNRGKQTTLRVSDGQITYNENSVEVKDVTYPFEKIKKSMIIDTLHSPKICGIVDYVDIENQIIHLLDGWWSFETKEQATPINNIGFEVDRITKVWSNNTNVFLFEEDPAKEAVAEEIGLFDMKGGDMGGIDLVNFSDSQANFGFKARNRGGFGYAFKSEKATNHFTGVSTNPNDLLLRSDLDGDINKGFKIRVDGRQSKLRLNVGVYTENQNNVINNDHRLLILNGSTGVFRLPVPASRNGEMIILQNISSTHRTIGVSDDAGLIYNGRSSLSTRLPARSAMVLFAEGPTWYVLNLSMNNTIVQGGIPTETPSFIGQEHIDTENKKVYKAFGVGSVSDWVIMN